MLALCLMLSGTCYAKNYAGIIGRGLIILPESAAVWIRTFSIPIAQLHYWCIKAHAIHMTHTIN